MMKTILVPTDFSDNARTALDFAVMLAREHGARLIVLHVLDLPDQAVPAEFEVIRHDERILVTLGNLKQLCEEIEREGRIRCEYHALEGLAAETIVDYASGHKVDMIVMAAQSRNNLGEVIFGTTTSEVIRRTDCTVVSVPLACRINAPLARVTYATDFFQSDLGAIRALTSWIAPFNSHLCIVHVSTDPEAFALDINKISVFTNLVESETGYKRLSFELLEGDDAEAELVNYISAGKTDMLVVSTEHRSGLARILSPSATTHLIQVSSVPVVAFHHGKREKRVAL